MWTVPCDTTIFEHTEEHKRLKAIRAVTTQRHKDMHVYKHPLSDEVTVTDTDAPRVYFNLNPDHHHGAGCTTHSVQLFHLFCTVSIYFTCSRPSRIV